MCLSAKDKEKEAEVSPEKKGKEGEKDVENGKAESTVDEYTSSLGQCPVFYDFGTMVEPISGRLAQDLSYSLITALQQECTRASSPEMKAGEWVYLCVAHGNDGAMEVCFVHNITSTINLTSWFCTLGSIVAL